MHDKIEFEIADGGFDAFSKSKITNTYKFLNKIEREKYYNSLKILTEFQIKNFETEFEKCNKKLLELENSRITLVKSFKEKKKF